MASVAQATTSLDKPSLDLLLNELSTDLPSDVTSLLDNEYLHDEILKYLSSISSIDSRDYLSSVPPTPGNESIDEKTLIQDIAELEANQRSIGKNLKDLIIKSKDSIIANKDTLIQTEELFKNDFSSTFKTLWRTFNENNLEDIDDKNEHNEDDEEEDDDDDLYELEHDLIKDTRTTKDSSFRSTISHISGNINPTKSNEDHNLSTVLQNMDQILSILELPSLAAACIKAGHYSEALEISSYTRRLAIRFPQSDLIKSAESGIEIEMSYMLNGLIRLLRTNLKQSSLIKTMSYLKRVPPFSQLDTSDGQLKRILLHARYDFIKSEFDSLSPLKEGELYEKYLKRSVEVIREHGFGSIITYRNIFPDIIELELKDVELVLEEVQDESPLQNPGTSEENLAETTIEKNEDSLEEGVEQATEETIEKDTDENLEEGNEKNLDHTGEAEGEEQKGEESTFKEDNFSEPQVTEKTEETDTPVTEEINSGNIDKGKEVNSSEEKEINQEEAIEPSEDNTELDIILPNDQRKISNILLYEFVEQVLQDLLTIIKSSISQLHDNSSRDGLYLQLIYCALSLSRIDENFGDLMTVVLLNAKNEDDEFVIDRKAWIGATSKQRILAKNLKR